MCTGLCTPKIEILQGPAKRWSPGLLNLVTAVAFLLPGFACCIHTTWGPSLSQALYFTTARNITMVVLTVFPIAVIQSLKVN